MKIVKIVRLCCCLAAGIGLPAHAQLPVIKASIDSAQILIGEQTRLHLDIAVSRLATLQMPLVADTLMQGVEVLDMTMPDTTDLGNDRIRIQYQYLITSFDSALYLLPAFRLIAGVDTVYSNRVALKVSSLPVDTESGEFYDIKDVWKPEFVLGDYAAVFYVIFAVCVLILAMLYFIFRKKKQKAALPSKKEKKNLLPPHVRAIQALDAVKNEKLWQQGKEKEYHSKLSDIIRTYVDERFGVNAMEMTSGQILQAVQGISEVDPVFGQLKQMLLLSDLAKFAKYQPQPDENEQSLMHSYLFVHSTTPAPPPVVEEEKEKNNPSKL
jgi:hypothetical protein